MEIDDGEEEEVEETKERNFININLAITPTLYVGGKDNFAAESFCNRRYE